MSLKPGDLCWLVGLTQNWKQFNGRQCLVMSTLHIWKFKQGPRMAHEIQIIGEPGTWQAVPSILKKQPPDNERLRTQDALSRPIESRRPQKEAPV